MLPMVLLLYKNTDLRRHHSFFFFPPLENLLNKFQIETVQSTTYMEPKVVLYLNPVSMNRPH